MGRKQPRVFVLAALAAVAALACVTLLVKGGSSRGELLAAGKADSALHAEQQAIARLTKEVKQRRQSGIASESVANPDPHAEYAAKQERKAVQEESHDASLVQDYAQENKAEDKKMHSDAADPLLFLGDYAQEKKAEDKKMHSALHALSQEADSALEKETGAPAVAPHAAHKGLSSTDAALEQEVSSLRNEEVSSLRNEVHSMGAMMRSQKHTLQ
ncbi:hypothetical protein T484DRAFT_1835596, partial [Baffinella frigidus]